MENRIFFNAGDLVRVKHDLKNKPEAMLVVHVRKLRSTTGNSSLSGIECVWFDKNQVMRKELFNTKDLENV